MPIRLYDSLTRSLKELRRPDPADPKDVFSFYNCGPTVYAAAHIGNFRTFVINDVLRRLLILEYGADKVKYVRNLTDVDDKTIKRARDEGRPLAEVTKQWTDKFHADCDALNCLPMDKGTEPTATGYIKEQVNMIDVLMQKGNAYRAADGSVYFKVSSFEGYGALSRVKERELKVGSALAGKSQAADADEKEDVSDFALWKAWKPEDGPNRWDDELKPRKAAAGRPGWHIECSAMSKALLGNTIDLHTGGEDLEFPHHENEIAQSECCNGVPFARHWFHSKHLLVDGKKMSKSLGNLYTLDDLKAKGFSPMTLRFALLSGHPRKQLNFSIDSLHAAESALQTAFAFHQKLVAESLSDEEGETEIPNNDKIVASYFWSSLKDDLNIPGAFGALYSFARIIGDRALSKPVAKGCLDELERMFFALGLQSSAIRSMSNELAQASTIAWRNRFDGGIRDPILKKISQLGYSPLFSFGKAGYELRPCANELSTPAEITALAEKRWAAKQAKDWVGADALRKELTAAGWSMLDGKDGYKLEPLKK